MSGLMTKDEITKALAKSLDEAQLQSMSSIALAIADGDNDIAAALLSASAGYTAMSGVSGHAEHLEHNLAEGGDEAFKFGMFMRAATQ